MNCTRCEGTGFLNINQVDDEVLKQFDQTGNHSLIIEWAETHESDVGFCDCCGDGDGWYDIAGEHNPHDYGKDGPYAYNGGLPECF